MKEAQIQTIFKNINKVHGVFELKLCKGKSIRWDAVKLHQIAALRAVKGNGLYHKLTDPPIFGGMKTRFNCKRPFDCFYLKETPAFVVICWYVPRKKKNFYYIDIDRYIIERMESPRKSFTEEEAADMCSFLLPS